MYTCMYMYCIHFSFQFGSHYVQIQDEVEIVHGKNVVSPNVIVGMFLVSQGADTYTKNLKGISPLQIRPTDVSALMSQCRGRGYV